MPKSLSEVISALPQEAQDKIERRAQELSQQKKRHGIMEFKGIADGAWKDVDPQTYIAKERDSWDADSSVALGRLGFMRGQGVTPEDIKSVGGEEITAMFEGQK